jgi:hypothetical protein
MGSKGFSRSSEVSQLAKRSDTPISSFVSKTPRRLESDRATHSEARIARFDARLCKGDGAGIQVAKHWLAFVSCTFVQGLRILLFVGSCVGTKESRDVQIVVLLE